MPSLEPFASRLSSAEDVFGPEDLLPVPLHRLRLEHPNRFPIQTEDGVLLLARGSVVTERFLERLAQRDLSTVLVHRAESAVDFEIVATGAGLDPIDPSVGRTVRAQTEETRRLDANLLVQVSTARDPDGRSLLEKVPERGTEPYDQAMARGLFHAHEKGVDGLRSVAGALADGIRDSERVARTLVVGYLPIVLQDLDMAGCFAGAPLPGDYPFRHGLHVCLLSLAMGLRAGLDARAMESLGLGAMLHDLGMLRVAAGIRHKSGPLDENERALVCEHPIRTIDGLKAMVGISDDARYVCYQVHERPCGTGYPRQAPGSLLHPLAKLAAIADAYVALVTERPYRPAILPHRAIEAVLSMAETGHFDSEAARLLLETVSLFPLGSYVRLRDGRTAKTIRSNGAEYARPVLQAWSVGASPCAEHGEFIDLRVRPDLEIAEAIPAPNGYRARGIAKE